ncbi:MAG TPA: alpha/beta hydrolase, partial [Phaeodactylibacter sp.]|nr:alpha/beta hydrolase [Phaeodactylibacter sp.]
MLKVNDIIKNKKRPKEKKPQRIPLSYRMVQFAFGTLGRAFPKPFAKLAFRFFTTPRRRAKHKKSDPILETAQVSEMLVGRNMIKMYEWGTGKKTILLVHGWESRGTALRSFVMSLVAAGYRVATFDAPAHGDSGGKRVHLVTYSEAFKALYYKYENVESIITHSFGGVVAVYAMVKLDSEMTAQKMVMIASPS